MHNQELKKQRDEVLGVLNLTLEDLSVQRDDHEKYAPVDDRDEILAEIDNHLEALDNAKAIVNEWAIKLDSSISTKVF
jgi:hypothetical protein